MTTNRHFCTATPSSLKSIFITQRILISETRSIYTNGLNYEHLKLCLSFVPLKIGNKLLRLFLCRFSKSNYRILNEQNILRFLLPTCMVQGHRFYDLNYESSSRALVDLWIRILTNVTVAVCRAAHDESRVKIRYHRREEIQTFDQSPENDQWLGGRENLKICWPIRHLASLASTCSTGMAQVDVSECGRVDAACRRFETFYFISKVLVDRRHAHYSLCD